MTGKSTSWFDKPMPLKVFTGLSVSLFLFWIIERLISGIYDNDMYWMIATGREITENGIPYNNVWTIDHSSGFVAQQWLYAVVLAFADKFGSAGFSVLMGVQFAVLSCLIIRFFRMKNISAGKAVFSGAIMTVFCQIYMFTVRPELITLILLFGECVALEDYIRTKKCRYLIWLPVLMLLEANFHASMCVFHYAILMAYIVPAFYYKSSVKNSLCKDGKHMLPFIAVMTAVMWLNPYGTDSVLYTVKSFIAKTFSYVQITEMIMPYILSECTITLVIAAGILFLCLKFKYIESTSFNMFLGFSLLVTFALRNVAFMTIVILFLFRDFWQAIDGKVQIDWKKDVKNNLYLIFAVGYAIIGLDFCSHLAPDPSSGSHSSSFELTSICDYIKESGGENAHIFTGFDNGGFFEYNGFKNIYIDARPELYLKEFTGGKNILADYVTYGIGYSNFSLSKLHSKTSAGSIEEWLSVYDFDYLVVNRDVEYFLAGYMQACDNYKAVKTNGVKYILYERTVDVNE